MSVDFSFVLLSAIKVWLSNKLCPILTRLPLQFLLVTMRCVCVSQQGFKVCPSVYHDCRCPWRQSLRELPRTWMSFGWRSCLSITATKPNGLGRRDMWTDTRCALIWTACLRCSLHLLVFLHWCLSSFPLYTSSMLCTAILEVTPSQIELKSAYVQKCWPSFESTPLRFQSKEFDYKAKSFSKETGVI